MKTIFKKFKMILTTTDKIQINLDLIVYCIGPDEAF